jgi:hypothetical protein
MKRLATAVIAVLALAAALVPATAMARDRNHDRIPDKWEKRFHLSLHHNQAGRDQDHDGLRNLAEFRNHSNPRKADTDGDGLDDGDEVETDNDPSDDDSDNDGIEDGDENAGTVKSFDNGVLTIALAKGGDVSGAVTGDTEIECDGQGDDNDDQGDDDAVATASESGDDGGDGDASCGPDALKPGTTVKEAELRTVNGTLVFHEVALLG